MLHFFHININFKGKLKLAVGYLTWAHYKPLVLWGKQEIKCQVAGAACKGPVKCYGHTTYRCLHAGQLHNFCPGHAAKPTCPKHKTSQKTH